jgi:transposase
MARENEQDHDSVWRAVDLGVWRIEVRARLRRLRCPVHGAHVEGVPFARDGARFTRDFEDVVAWLMTKTDRTAVCRLMRIDWETVGRIIKRVGDELLPADRLNNLFEISLDEVAWRKGHRYLTLVGDHRQSCVVWGTEGKGQAAADEFFAELDPPPAPSKQPRQPPEPGVMVPFGPCPTVPAGESVPAAWLQDGRELDPQLVARASRLTAISMDMTGGYAKSVREHAPQAEIVIDNYHVVALATKALDEVRREHWNELRRLGELGAAKAFNEDTTQDPPRWLPGDGADRAATTSAGGPPACVDRVGAPPPAARVVRRASGRQSLAGAGGVDRPGGSAAGADVSRDTSRGDAGFA